MSVYPYIEDEQVSQAIEILNHQDGPYTLPNVLKTDELEEWRKKWVYDSKLYWVGIVGKIIYKRHKMITIQDLYNIVGKKITNEKIKTIIRNNMPPQMAEQMCNAIDANEKAEHFQRYIREWMECQQKQQMIFQSFLRQYYGK